ncbi:unnamed protein product [Ceutorhynchus assimilis]|uniref:Polycomb protein VEFS-Box domain-containing protein n=1 Tax=Ceutorhynchus assimilis TaxID=467358 RepID=A0A9N9QM14_9CUCU|nr:unnamed protein product [Ceutorhynchus assimilis]
MPPKKREKEIEPPKNPRIDHIQADHELFLQAFEKPTQIYRYLRTRHMCSPIFLNRNLTYMRERMSRTNKNRRNFKIDNLLEITKKALTEKKDILLQPGYINLTFLGFNSTTSNYESDFAHVETVLLKITHNKRKDSSATSMQITLGTADVPINPLGHLPLTAPTISIPTDTFNSANGPLVKSFILLFKVKVNVDIDNNTDSEEPPLKKRKTNGETMKLYTAELTIYDKHNRCCLTDGDYDIVVQEFAKNLSKSVHKKHSTWENVSDLLETCNSIDTFLKGAILKFKLNWSNQATAKLVDRPKLYPLDNKENNGALANADNKEDKIKKLEIVYQFVYNNNSRQQTEASEDLHCPWCSVNCHALYTLLKHLKLCHSRFTFTYVPMGNRARIDIAINEMYDGSYTGSPHDLITSFSRNGPVRRASVTHILVCYPKRPKPSLSEFLELDDCEYDGQRPFITGHNRLYHHTNTCLPIFPKEMDCDSEGENDPEWLQNKTRMMIDEFTDVNEGEKELMKMWNLHVMKYGYVGDCQIPRACQMFVQQKGKELLLKNLYRNFVLHLTSLFDFGLLSAVCLYTTLQKLQQMMGESEAIKTVLKQSRQAQLDAHKLYKANPLQSPHPSEKQPSTSKTTPQAGRKTGNIGLQRRVKGGPDGLPTRRKSVCVEGAPTKKRLSLNKAS